VLLCFIYFSKVEIAKFLLSFRCLNNTQFDLNNYGKSFKIAIWRTLWVPKQLYDA